MAELVDTPVSKTGPRNGGEGSSPSSGTMSWATNYIQQLREGKVVRFRPRGNSMRGKINSGNLVIVEPLADYIPEKGDIVLCKVRGRSYLHLIKAVRSKQFLIGNNRGGTNGWITINAIYGLCTQIKRG